MKSNYKKLGDFLHVVDERNSRLDIKNLIGINITKNYMPSVANTSGVDLSRYKIVRKGQFACNIMHVGRDERLPVSLYTKDNPSIISPAYISFEIKRDKKLIPEFLMMLFQRGEFDRYTWFVSDSSVRGGLEWERLCEIELPIPDDVEEQKKYSAIYNGLQSNQLTYENTLSDLQIITDSFMDSLIQTQGTQVLGQYIKQLDKRNQNLEINNLLGISIEKKFFPSNTNQSSLDLKGFKIIKKNQFAFVTVTSRNGNKISIALLDGPDGVVSSTYITFEVIDKKVLLPEFLLLWFKRAEFDRYARFHSWGSARETFNWDDMSNVKLPIPNLETQKSIVAIHHALETRKRINDELKDLIAPLTPVLWKGVQDSLSKQYKFN